MQDATQVRVTGLEGLRFEDKLLGTTGVVQQGVFQLDTACDRIYQHDMHKASQHYTLHDDLCSGAYTSTPRVASQSWCGTPAQNRPATWWM